MMPLTSNLPDAPANSIVVDPNDANTAYLAMDTGVYVTTNVSSCAVPFESCWSVFGTSLPNAPVVQLVAFNEGSTSVLRAASYGRGVWQIGLVTAGTAMTTASAKPTALIFPSRQVQTPSATQIVVVTNTGNITLNATQVNITGDFVETDDCGGHAVIPGDACTVNVTFTPSQTRQRTGTLTVYGNISGGKASGQVTVALSGTGVTAVGVVLTPSTLSFAETLLGKTAASQDITISNTGGLAASLTRETVTGDFAISANTCTGSLNPNSGCTLSITFSPTASGSRAGVLTVVDSAGTQTAQISGIGESLATDGLAPLSLAFAGQFVGTRSPTQQVTLTNNGDQALQLITTQVDGDFNAVNNCGTSLEGHSTCAIVVNYLPTQLGSEAGTLFVSDALRTQTVSLSGTGLAPAGVSATPAAVNFGNYAVGKTSGVQAVTLTNNGGVPLTGLQFTVTGDFSIQPVSGAGASLCGTTLAVVVQCEIGMVFSPSQAGVRSGSLTVTGTELIAPRRVALSGNGEDFRLQVSGSSSAVVVSGQTATFPLLITPVDGSTGTVALICAGAPQNAPCTVNPTSVTLTGSSTAGPTVTVTTGQASSSASLKSELEKTGLALALLLPVGFLAGRRGKWKGTALVGLLMFFLPIGCGLGVTQGSGGSTNPSSPPTAPANPTPSGTYILTVTGNAPGLSHAVTLTLTVE